MTTQQTTNNMIKAFNPEECLFIGTINELQQTLQETTRIRMRAENKLLNISKDDQSYDLYKSYLRLCKEWESSLTEELIKRIPKDQQKLL